MTHLPYAALVTLLVVALTFWTSILVGKARYKYEVKAPATTGHEMFDRAYRVQMNTIESALLLLPALWIYAAFIGDPGAGVAGLIWVIARIVYGIDYLKDPAKRGRDLTLHF
ncbi:MAG: MAPEG family protein [Limnohabitans sp.]|nr:MAPEG family protein [Limnohabitans sp.]